MRIPKYRLHKKTQQALVEIKGRRIYLGKHGTEESKEKYRRIIAELVSGDGSISTPDSASALTVNQLILRYFNFATTYYVKNGKPTDEIAALRAIFKRLRSLYGHTLAYEFGAKKFKTLRESLVNEGLSRKYCNDCMGRVRRMFRWAAAEELVPASVFQSLSAVAGLKKGRSAARETPPVPPIPDEVVEATLPFLPEIVADMIRLQRLTGMRPGEVCRLRPCDLDRSGDVWLYHPAEHKTEHAGRDRVIPIGPRAQEILLRYLARDAQSCCFRPCDSEQKRRARRTAARTTPLTHGNRPGTNLVAMPKRTAGEAYTVDSYRRAIHRACDKAFPYSSLKSIKRSDLTATQAAELKNWQKRHRWSPNQLRHSTATEVRRNFGLEAAQTVLGHSRADVTQVYAERDLRRAVEVARRIG